MVYACLESKDFFHNFIKLTIEKNSELNLKTEGETPHVDYEREREGLR